jgi:hypothetical protein
VGEQQGHFCPANIGQMSINDLTKKKRKKEAFLKIGENKMVSFSALGVLSPLGALCAAFGVLAFWRYLRIWCFWRSWCSYCCFQHSQGSEQLLNLTGEPLNQNEAIKCQGDTLDQVKEMQGVQNISTFQVDHERQDTVYKRVVFSSLFLSWHSNIGEISTPHCK